MAAGKCEVNINSKKILNKCLINIKQTFNFAFEIEAHGI